MRALLLFLFAACVPRAAALDAAMGTDAADGQADASPDAGEPDDAGVIEDSGVVADAGGDEDAAEPDAAAPGHCPTDVNPACTSASTCGADMPAPTNCDVCVPSNLALCVDATCETPPPLDSADIYAIATQVDPTIPLLESIGAFALASRTAGRATITCAEIYAGLIDFSDRCYNVLDSKSINVSQTGDTYTVAFNGFTSGQRTLFVLYGFESTGAGGPAVGVSCTEVDVGPPMGGVSQFFAGDRMMPR